MKLTVVGLCAQWCGLCREFETTFAQLAQAMPDHQFVWMDIEDCDLWHDEVDIETFPTLLILGADMEFKFFGPVLPGLKGLIRMLQEAESAPFHGAMPEALTPFLGRIQQFVQTCFSETDQNHVVCE